MILVDQPWFNEPGADALQGTPEGDAKSKEASRRAEQRQAPLLL